MSNSLEPTVKLRSSTPSVARMSFSTGSASFPASSRPTPAGNFWLALSVSEPMSPRKSVLRSGTKPSVRISTRTLATSVMTGWRTVQPMTGVYVFCSLVTGDRSPSSSSISLSASGETASADSASASGVADEVEVTWAAGATSAVSAATAPFLPARRRSLRSAFRPRSPSLRRAAISFFWARLRRTLDSRACRNQNARTGTIVSATSSDASRAIEVVSANGRNSSPVWPDTKTSGRNTATVVSVEAVMAPATSPTAARMFLNLVPPIVWRRRMASITTIESSTTRPIEMVSAESVSMLSE